MACCVLDNPATFPFTSVSQVRAVPASITDPRHIADLDIRRRDRLGGVIHEYRHAA